MGTDEYGANDQPHKLRQQRHALRIQFRNGNVTKYIYASDGTKLRTIHRISRTNLNVPYGTSRTLTSSETLSVDSTSYIGSLEIDKNFNSKYYFNDGYISLTNTASGTYHVFAKDHLGNVRAVVDSNGKIEQEYNYYAFGGLLNDVTNTADAQTHKYNGKELDRVSGLELYDYGARNYDAAIGQFTTMDPLCEKYYGISPYAYCGSNPINRIDPDGCQFGDYFTKYGDYIGSDGINDNKLYVITENTKDARKEFKNDGKISDETRSKATYICNTTSMKESYDILMSNSNNELGNIVYTDGSKESRKEGTEATMNFIVTDTKKEVDALIHLHPLGITENRYHPIDPSSIDNGTFKNYNRNIIVGYIKVEQIAPSSNTMSTETNVGEVKTKLGMAIFDSNSNEIFRLSKPSMESIIKHINHINH